jgi:hypothetical protein
MQIIEKLQLHENKSLKIANALIREIPTFEKIDQQRVIYMMESYIKSKGLKTKGPLISSSSGIKGFENGMPVVSTKIIMQLAESVDICEPPYTFEPLMRIGPCLYVRFIGKPQQLNFAYSKLGVYAFENDIELDGSSYTVFVNQNGDEAMIDVFMPLKKAVNDLEAVHS